MLEPVWLVNSTVAAAAESADGSGSAPLVVLFLVACLVIVGLAVKGIDLRRRRSAEAVHLQAVISDALIREPALFGLAITPNVHLPFWRGTPATIAVSGTVPTPERRDAVLRIVKAEASRIRPDVAIDDRLAVFPGARTAS